MPADAYAWRTLRALARYRVTAPLRNRHSDGIFIGDVGDLDDLVCYWNLQASGLDLKRTEDFSVPVQGQRSKLLC